MAVKAIPDGYHGVTPYIVMQGAAEARTFYAKAFGAVDVLILPMPDGSIAHAEMKIGGAYFMFGEESAAALSKSPLTLGGTTAGLMIYMENVDAFVEKAIAAGCTVQRPLENQFYGDRSATLVDPFGHQWTFATHIEDVSAEEMNARMAKMMG